MIQLPIHVPTTSVAAQSTLVRRADQRCPPCVVTVEVFIALVPRGEAQIVGLLHDHARHANAVADDTLAAVKAAMHLEFSPQALAT